MINLMLPGNPRYQPKELRPYWGYDRLVRYQAEVEIAVMQTLGQFGVIPAADIGQLTEDVIEELLSITTTEVDEREEVTKHDVRALVQLMQERLPEPLRRWCHVPLTSYDVIETARALQFRRAHFDVVVPKLNDVMRELAAKAEQYARTPQIGRTHGQHALPITVGFWLATVLSRLLANAEALTTAAHDLVGKISGATGAYNAQDGLGISREGRNLEVAALHRLGLHRARISTQIAPPEPLANYLHRACLVSAALAQFGNDARHLMRTEIGELHEPFDSGQVGSSTMAHKRNPLNFENLTGMWLRSKSEYGKVLDTLISEHQRDLVGSSLVRDLPIIVVNLVTQLNTLLRKKDNVPFIRRIAVDEQTCARNLALQGDAVLAEPIYLSLQMAGYAGDAHEVVNHRAFPLMQQGLSLVEAVGQLAVTNEELGTAWERTPPQVRTLFHTPAAYVGKAAEKTLEICALARRQLS